MATSVFLGSGMMRASRKTLTNDQVLAIGDTPIQVADAPGTNRMIVPVQAVMVKYQPTLNSYADGDTLYLTYTQAFDDDGTGFTLAASSLLGGGPATAYRASPFIQNFTGILNAGAENFVNQGLWLYGDANFTGGDPTTTVTISVLYAVLDVTTGQFE